MPSTPFFIPDTSPLFNYTPSNSWLGAYRPKGDGWDQTFHMTASGDAVVSINVTASSIRFQTSSSSSISTDNKDGDEECEAEYRINGTDWSDACRKDSDEYVKEGLPWGLHMIELKGKNGGGIEFMGLEGELPMYTPGSAINRTMDNTDSIFNYTNSDQWTLLSANDANAAYSNFTLKTMYEGEGLNAFYGSSLAGTTAQGAKVELTFQSEAIYVYGLSGPNSGTAQISLDGQIQQNINMKNAWETHGALLYVGGGFNPNETHTLSIVNNQQGEQLIIDYALLSIPQAEEESHIPLIAGISGGVSALLILLGLCGLFIVRRNKRRTKATKLRQQNVQYAFANGIGKDGPLNSGKSFSTSTLNDWRRPPSSLLSPNTPASSQSLNNTGEYIWGTGRPAGLDLSYTRSPNTGTPGINNSTNHGVQSHSQPIPPPFNSPPPDYPDYIPYQPPASESTGTGTVVSTSGKSAYRPVNPRSNTAPNLSSSTSPQLAVINPSTPLTAGGWAQSANRAISPSGSLGNRKSPLIDRINPLGPARSKPEYDDIALDNYTPRHPSRNQRPITPPPIPAEYGDYTPTTAHTPYRKYTTSPSTMTHSPSSSIGVQRTATRSSIMSNIPRLTSVREAISSIYNRTNSTGPDSSLKLVTTTGGSEPGSMALTTSGLPTASSNSTPKTPKYIQQQSEEEALRRGLSVKSNKTTGTMKSWLSNLVFAPSTSNGVNVGNLPSLPSTPILPQAAARPDSGIFPLALNGSVHSIPLRSGSGNGTPVQMVPSTATRSFFGGVISSPSTSKTLNGSWGNSITPKSDGSSPFAYTTSTGTIPGGNPIPSRSTTGSSSGGGYGYGYSNDGNGDSSGMGNQMFIELNPNSPIMGDSRPGSEWTNGPRLY
ncbi:hypothetical protein I203_107220 [Kwoniella mangroviensis CBS 8507]|uniref:hypothetical protein n=1 Tax=Kwoniella mangroviensis CBS 8507 TaxID=1296122 RepID=UPI00080CD54E|nr:uncharacterized protein I203_01968 [Kwoniella mangroviensis CBS 8507]OCF68585.1 hypothetical protein I203_01968 [Kwoniella mangroviensis CBS 8507]